MGSWLHVKHPEWWIDRQIAHFLDASDAVVVSGFWRSGTTWLQQSLAQALSAKSVLEPLYPRFGLFRKTVLPKLSPTPGSEFSKLAFVPFFAETGDPPQFLISYLERALTSALPGVYVRTTRYDVEEKRGIDSLVSKAVHRIRDSLKRQVVVKFTRGPLLLSVIRSHFNPTILHIRRDPRAVWASLKRTGWKWPREFSLVTHLLELDDGRRALFERHAETINRVEDMGAAARTAAYWACLEEYVQRRGVGNKNFSLLSYERLCFEGTDYLFEKLQGGEKPLEAFSSQLRRDSATTQHGREGTSTEKRVNGWKDELPAEEVNQIERAITMLGASDLVPDSHSRTS